MAVQFEDYSIKIKAALDDAAIAFLNEVAESLADQAAMNTSKAKDHEPDVRNSWEYKVDEAEGVAKIGSKLEAVYWTEFGTGDYAIHHDGRPGWWVYIEGQSSQGGGKTYTSQEEAEAAAMFLRKVKHLKAYATKGKEAERPLFSAYNHLKTAIIKRAEEIFGSELK